MSIYVVRERLRKCQKWDCAGTEWAPSGKTGADVKHAAKEFEVHHGNITGARECPNELLGIGQCERGSQASAEGSSGTSFKYSARIPVRRDGVVALSTIAPCFVHDCVVYMIYVVVGNGIWETGAIADRDGF